MVNSKKKRIVALLQQLLMVLIALFIMINSFETGSILRIAASSTGFVIFATFASMVGYKLYKKS